MRKASRLLAVSFAALFLLQVLFGRDHVGHLLGIPFWNGVPFGILVNGAVIGTLYALVAFGLILVYRATRIINFAQAAMGSFPALAGLLLVASRGWPYWSGVLVMLVGSALTGAVIEIGLLRRFAKQPRLIVTVVTIGVGYLLTFGESREPMLIAGQSLAPADFPSPFRGFHFNAGGFILNGDYLAVLAVALPGMVALAAVLRFSRIGIAIRASAENADRAALLGIPVQRVTTIVWMIAAVVAGLGAFLRAPVVGLQVGTGVSPAVLLYALTAAVIARMESLPVALAAGMGLGMMEQASVYGTNKPDLAVALVLPILLVSLLTRRGGVARALDSGVSSFRVLQEHRPIPRELSAVPAVRRARVVVAALTGALALGAPYLVGTARADKASFIVICAMVSVSMVVLSGWSGQISLGQFAFSGIGAAVAGGLATRLDADFFVTLGAAGIAGAVAAVLIGLPALRVQGLLLAAVTLGFAASVSNLLINRQYLGDLLPPFDASVNRPVLWDRVDVTSDTAFYYVCLTGLVLAVLCARAVRTSRSGRLFIGVRDNSRAAQSYGVSPTVTRLSAFAVSGFLAALAGALFVYQQGSLDVDSFAIDFSIEVFIFTAIGGLSGVGPAISGAVVFEGLKLLQPVQHLFGFNPTSEFIDTFFIHGSALFVLTFYPGGLGDLWYVWRDRWLRRVAVKHDIVVPSLVADRREVPVAKASALVPAPDAVLVCRGIDAGYDGVQVLFGVDLEVRRGEVLALLGTNGAGKSTLLRVISGLLPATRGTVHFLGDDVTRLDPVAMAKKHVVQVPGGRGIFPTLTVAEHFVAAAWLLKGDPDTDARRLQVLERFPRLQERYDQLAGNLSGGEQQQLAVGMAFLAKPDLLIIDELSLGLAPTIVEQLLTVVREINAQGTAVVLVEQSVNVALTVADRAYFMEKGEVLFEGPTAELLERDDIVRSVFLEGASTGRPATVEARAERNAVALEDRSTVLEVSDLAVSFGGIKAVGGVSLVLREAEILGLIGPNGAGKTTVFDLISGFLTPSSGRVQLLGQDVTAWSPSARARIGLGRSFQDARIFPSLTVAENIALSLERHLEVRDHLAASLGLPAVREVEEDIAWTVGDLVDLMGLGAFRDKFVSELSTGSRRVVDLAMAIAHDPTVLVLDEPSSGIAQAETEALGPLLERIRTETGCAMLVIEHDMPLITSLSDRLMALELGRVLAEGTPQEVVQDPLVIASYLGTDPDSATIARSGRAVRA